MSARCPRYFFAVFLGLIEIYYIFQWVIKRGHCFCNVRRMSACPRPLTFVYFTLVVS